MSKYIVAAALLMVLLVIFAISIILNKRTPLPKDFKLPSIQCKHCKSTSCGLSEVNRPYAKNDEVPIDCEEGSEE